MNSEFNTRFFCKNEHGRDLFYLDIVFVQGTDLIFIEHSLKCNVTAHPTAKILMDKIMQNPITEEERQGIITELFDFIKTIPGIEEFYFQNEVLNSDGNFLEYYASTIESLIEEKYFPDFTPFSCSCNSIYFDAFKRILANELNAKLLIPITREHFEELIINRKALQLEYIEYYSHDAQFFSLRKEYNHMFHEVYILTNKKQIILFFIHVTPE